MQSIYWKKMNTFKYNLLYLTLYFERCVKIKRGIKVTTAIFSSAAIAAWANWTQYAFIWGAIVVVCQVVGAASEVFPLQERISALSSLLGQLSVLYVDVESHWHEVFNGELSETQINDLIYKFENRWTIVDNKYFTSDALRQNMKIKEKAQAESDKYFMTLFNTEVLTDEATK